MAPFVVLWLTSLSLSRSLTLFRHRLTLSGPSPMQPASAACAEGMCWLPQASLQHAGSLSSRQPSLPPHSIASSRAAMSLEDDHEAGGHGAATGEWDSHGWRHFVSWTTLLLPRVVVVMRLQKKARIQTRA